MSDELYHEVHVFTEKALKERDCLDLLFSLRGFIGPHQSSENIEVYFPLKGNTASVDYLLSEGWELASKEYRAKERRFFVTFRKCLSIDEGGGYAGREKVASLTPESDK